MFKKILKPRHIGVESGVAFVGALFLLLLLQRAVPYLLYGPFGFGYDTGIYKHFFENISSLQDVLSSQISILPSGLAYLFNFFGLPLDWYLYLFYIVASAAVVWPLYFLTKEYFGKEEACLAAFLFTVSVVQVLASQFYLFKAMLGASFLLFALFFYARKSYWFYVFGFLLALTQLPQLLILLVAVSIDGILDFKNHKRFYLVGVIAAVAVAGLLLIYNFNQVEQAFQVVWSALTGTGGGFDSHQSGLFLSIPEYFRQALYIFLLGVTGVILTYRREKLLPLHTAVVALIMIVFWRLFFENRFLVEMDLLLLPFASFTVVSLFRRFLKEKTFLKGSGAVLLGVAVLISGFYYRTTLPALDESEVWALEILNEQEDGAVFVTDTRYAPWMHGFSNKETISPGLFNSVWDFETWVKYHGATEADQAQMLLTLTTRYKRYYLFEGGRQEDRNFEKYSENIEKIFAVNNVVIYRITRPEN